MCFGLSLTFLTSYLFLREKSFLLAYPVTTCFKYICEKSSFLNLFLLPINCSKTYCQSCKIPLKIRMGGGTVNDLF